MIRWEAPLADSPVQGHLVVPGSKSATARSLVLAALADHSGSVIGALSSRDSDLMLAALAGFGTDFRRVDQTLHATPGAAIRGGTTVDCGLAGTVMRFLPPVAALTTEPTRFVGDSQAGLRPMAPLLAALAAMGAGVSGDRLPFSITGPTSVLRTRIGLDASASSQFISGLLLSAARFPEGLTVVHTGDTLPSLPHIAMTARMLTDRGVVVERPDERTWRVLPGPIAGVEDLVEPDLTNAASLLGAAVVTGGTLTTAWPEDSLQAADALAEVLAAFGAELSYRGTGASRQLTLTGPERPFGVDVDLSAISELTPVVAAIAALAVGPSVIRGVGHIRGHETDRLAALETELTGLGAQVRQTADGLRLSPGSLHGATFHTWADHRLAHAGALIGLEVPGVVLDDVGCATKTLPDFPGMWRRLLEQAA